MPFSSLAAFAAATASETHTVELRNRRVRIIKGKYELEVAYPGVRRWHEVVCEAIALRLTALVIPLLLIHGLENIAPAWLHAAFDAARDQPALQLRLTAVALAHAHSACQRRPSRKRRAPAGSNIPSKRRGAQQQARASGSNAKTRTKPSQLSAPGNASAPSTSEALQAFKEVVRGVPGAFAGIHTRLLTALADLVARAEHDVNLPVIHDITCDGVNLPSPDLRAHRPASRRSAKMISQGCPSQGQMGCIAAVLALIEALPAAIESADPAFASVAYHLRRHGLLQSAVQSRSCDSTPRGGSAEAEGSSPASDSALSAAMTTVLQEARRPCAAAVAACLVALGAAPPQAAVAEALREGDVSALPAFFCAHSVNAPLVMRNVCPNGCCVSLEEDYPLSHAMRLHDSALVQWLLGAGADANAVSLVSGKTPMQELITGRLAGVAWYVLHFSSQPDHAARYLDAFREDFTAQGFMRLQAQARQARAGLSDVPLELGRCALALLDVGADVRGLEVPSWAMSLVGSGGADLRASEASHVQLYESLLSRRSTEELENPVLGEVISRSIAAGSAVGHKDACVATWHQMHWALNCLARAGVLEANAPDPSTKKSLAYTCLVAQGKQARTTLLTMHALADAGADLSLLHEEWVSDPADIPFLARQERLAECMLIRSVALGDLPYFERLLTAGLPLAWVSERFGMWLQMGQGTCVPLRKTSPLLCLRAMQAGVSMDCCVIRVCTPFLLALAPQDSQIHCLDCLDALKGDMAVMKSQGEMWQGGTLQHTCRLLNTHALTKMGVNPHDDVLQWLPGQVKRVAQTALLCMGGSRSDEAAEAPPPPLPNDCRLHILQLALGAPLCLIQHLCRLPAGQPCPLPIPFADA